MQSESKLTNWVIPSFQFLRLSSIAHIYIDVNESRRARAHTQIHTHTHTYIYIYIFINIYMNVSNAKKSYNIKRMK